MKKWGNSNTNDRESIIGGDLLAQEFSLANVKNHTLNLQSRLSVRSYVHKYFYVWKGCELDYQSVLIRVDGVTATSILSVTDAMADKYSD